jgi:hypothetical protein
MARLRGPGIRKLALQAIWAHAARATARRRRLVLQPNRARERSIAATRSCDRPRLRTLGYVHCVLGAPATWGWATGTPVAPQGARSLHACHPGVSRRRVASLRLGALTVNTATTPVSSRAGWPHLLPPRRPRCPSRSPSTRTTTLRSSRMRVSRGAALRLACRCAPPRHALPPCARRLGRRRGGQGGRGGVGGGLGGPRRHGRQRCGGCRRGVQRLCGGAEGGAGEGGRRAGHCRGCGCGWGQVATS